MAERRPPGFNVDLGFYDSDEVLSIPRKIRAAAVGVWTLCGAYSANKLTDGYMSAQALKDRGCTPAIRAALLATTKADGTPSPLWVDAGAGAIQFTGWPKWQRTAAEIKAFRSAEADRKRAAREAKKTGRAAHVSDTSALREPHVSDTSAPDETHVPEDMSAASAARNSNGHDVNSGNGKTSGRTSAGQPRTVRPEDGDPKTETETETKTEKRTGVTNGVSVATAPREEPHTPSEFCSKHPHGTTARCGDCANARKAFREWQRQRDYDEAVAVIRAADRQRDARKDTAACPDCDSNGLRYSDPDDPESPLTRCAHPNLERQETK